MSGVNQEVGDFKNFIMDNNIVRTSAGVCIALAAKDAIQSLVSDIIIPIIAAVFTSTKIEFLTQFLPETDKTNFDPTNFVKQVVTFILVIIISFIFVKFAFGYLLGVSYTNTKNVVGPVKRSFTINLEKAKRILQLYPSQTKILEG